MKFKWTRELRSLNIALIFKWWWRALKGGIGLCYELIKHIHKVTFESEEKLGKVSYGGTWAAIVKIGKELQNEGKNIWQFFRRQVGDGTRINAGTQ
ncbi:hypothetical protein E3N88_06690 [Mikania micrantha]|uniref:Uncharacterized protein n=1 Tax=Mikania micrantha TaxID=192012 RepID=A0A5N6PPD0_9ASTR|nr:hypothetical protein E3N88_06690 [Mikania micrantha]